MNVLFTATSTGLNDREHQVIIKAFQDHGHIVESLPYVRVIDHIKNNRVSQFALVDSIVFKADIDQGFLVFRFPEILELAQQLRELPDSCAMRDGRKWKSIPFIAISKHYSHFTYPGEILRLDIKLVDPELQPHQVVQETKEVVDDYMRRVLLDYQQLGIMVTFEKGRAKIAPAFRKKKPKLESNYYHPSADRRNHQGWVTVMRDREAIARDVDLFEELINKKVTEREMQRFFEENPFFLSQLRLGVQISHPSFKIKRWSPDFAFTSILGVSNLKDIDFLELKGPADKLLNSHKQHPGFASILHKAIEQVRDYGEMATHPGNKESILRQFGYIPQASNLAVVLGTDLKDQGKIEILEKRKRYFPDVEIVTYTKILETQDRQLRQSLA